LADTFNKSHIGVLFNAYNPTTGEGILFGNNAARERMKTEPSISILSDQKSRDPRIATSRDRPPTTRGEAERLGQKCPADETYPNCVSDLRYLRDKDSLPTDSV
jgi:hypothetical protein